MPEEATKTPYASIRNSNSPNNIAVQAVDEVKAPENFVSAALRSSRSLQS